MGLLGAAVGLTGVAAGARYAAELPGLPGLPLRLLAEPLTAALATVVALVSALVLLYAVGYVGEERDKARFYAGMSFFSAAMQTLVLAGDWILLLASWELIGLSSYLLIGFWYGREGVRQAATRAFLYTRTADLGLYVGIFVLITQTGTSEISATLEVGGAAATLAGLLLLMAAAGKSAQTPLQGWLQDAMVGPTPVSALLHSATLVAAGAILMIRVSPLLPQEVLLAVGLVGGLTLIVAGLIAVSQRDLKRLLAASTSSQYGFMLLAVGAGSPVAALVHLVAHAAIKAPSSSAPASSSTRAAPRSSLSCKESAAPAGGPSSASPSRDSRSPASRPSPGSSRRTLSSRPPSSLRTPPSSPRSPSPGRY